jgi:hypothetical protein
VDNLTSLLFEFGQAPVWTPRNLTHDLFYDSHSILKDYAGGAGGVDMKQGKALLKLIQVCCVKRFLSPSWAISINQGMASVRRAH